MDDVVKLPYYGGSKGQVLEIRQRPDGTIYSRILVDEIKTDISKEDLEKLDKTKSLIEEATRPEAKQETENTFEINLQSIQLAAAELVSLQENFKKSGELNSEQQKKYTENLEKLGVSAQKLAHIQQDSGDDFRLLFDSKSFSLKLVNLSENMFFIILAFADRHKGGSKKKVENVKFPPYAKKPQVEVPIIKKKEECGENGEGNGENEEENVGEEGDEMPSTTMAPTTTSTTKKPAPDTVTVDAPITETPVAEAKPVGEYTYFQINDRHFILNTI